MTGAPGSEGETLPLPGRDPENRYLGWSEDQVINGHLPAGRGP